MPKRRLVFIVVLLTGGLLGLLWRAIDLTVINQHFLKKQGDVRTLRQITIPAHRGMILDRNGQPLAISTPVAAVWINPNTFAPTDQQQQQLIQLLGLSPKKLNKLKNKTDKEFLYLKRGITPKLAQQLESLSIDGLYTQREYRRYYPDGEVSAHLLGITNIDDQGQEGLELAYNEYLQGVPGIKKVLRDRRQQVIADLETIQAPKAGRDLQLSIDRRLQFVAYQELKSAIVKHAAESGTCVMLDAKTGEVLAMVNQPSFNPNQQHRQHSANYRNRALTDLYEPGSVIKTFAIANALESGLFDKESVINTAPGWIRLSGYTIKDIRNFKQLNLEGILRHSSNVGIAKLVMSLPAEAFVAHFEKLGFGEKTAVHFPGESQGVINQLAKKQTIDRISLGYGYGLSVTPLQLARAFTVFTRQGRLLPMSLLKLQYPPKDERVFTPETAQTMLDLLQAIVEKGSGRKAKVPGYAVAGKTGTTRLMGANGYLPDHHRATFAGIVPANDPKLIIVVMINDPKQGSYYGGAVAAPVFAEIAKESLRMLTIFPKKSEVT